MSYTPPPFQVQKETIGIPDLSVYPSGSTYGAGRVVTNKDNKEIEICYDYSDARCKECTVVKCPFNIANKERI